MQDELMSCQTHCPSSLRSGKVKHCWKHEWGAITVFCDNKSKSKAAWAVPSREVINDELWLVHWSVDREIRREEVKAGEYLFDIKRALKGKHHWLQRCGRPAIAGHKWSQLLCQWQERQRSASTNGSEREKSRSRRELSLSLSLSLTRLSAVQG